MENHPVYGISAPEKGWVPSPSYLLRRKRVLNLLDPFPRGRLLEIGCGAGALLHDLSHMGFLVEATEISSAALDVAHYINQDDPRVTIHQYIQHKWDREFNYILALEVLEHIDDDLSALKQWRGWLKPEGYLLISVPAHPERWNYSDEWAGHHRRYDREGLKGILEKAGFEIVQMECYGFPLANIIGPIRARYHAKQLKRQLYTGNKDDQRADRSKRSGVERSVEKRLYPLQANWLGTKMMQLFCALQGIFLDTDLGNGFLVLCRKR
jgi:SAM-dependent methyltransferase